MYSYIELITTPTADTAGTAMLLDVGKKRYLFGNVHEGLSRACIQRDAKISKITDIFITGKTEWQNVGGLFGIIMSLADANASAIRSEKENLENKKKKGDTPETIAAKAKKKAKHDNERAEIFREAGLNPDDWMGAPDKFQDAPRSLPTLNVHGGRNLMHTIATGRRFIFRRGMPIEVHESVRPQSPTRGSSGRDPDWKDDSIQVWKLPIEPMNAGRSPKSPRKRSFDDYTAESTASTRHRHASMSTSHQSQRSQSQDDEQRKFVVSEMFNSKWKLDTLVETPLVQVPVNTPMWVRNEATNKLEKYHRPDDGTIPPINVLIRHPWPGTRIERLPPTKPSKTSMSYIIRHYPQRGKFIPEKAKALNIHHLVYQAIQQGATVKSRDGVTVTPDMVLEPTRPGGGFAMVDIPSADYIADLLGREEWNMPDIVDGLQAIFWNLGPGVANDATVQSFIHNHQDLKHIVISPETSANNITFDSSAALLVRLNHIDSERYSIPLHQDRLQTDPAARRPVIDACLPPHLATQRLHVQLEPTLKVEQLRSDHDLFNVATVLESMPKEILDHVQQAKADLAMKHAAKVSSGDELPSGDAEIICLGTGSSAPSKYRNVSATLLRVPGCGSYLFDCGEGTLGQLKRLYTATQLKDLFLDLKAIWISHLHADHHLGTTSVIKAWYEANYDSDTAKAHSKAFDEHRKDPIQAIQQNRVLFLFSEGKMIQWLQEYSTVEDFGYQRLIPIRAQPSGWNDTTRSPMDWDNVQVGFRTDNAAMNEFMQQATGMKNLVTCNVDHCHHAQAVSVTFPSGFKFSYSGDCRPSRKFVGIGQGSTILVHEATFDDEMQGDAEAKKHSTMSEAIGVAQAMNAKRLILTHFSQRYQKIPQLGALDDTDIKFEDVETVPEVDRTAGTTEGLDTIGSMINSGHQQPRQRKTTLPPIGRNRKGSSDLKIAIAFDLLRVQVKDIAYLECLTPVLQRMFEISEEEAKAKAKENPSELARKSKAEGKAKKKGDVEKHERDGSTRERKEGWIRPSKERVQRGQNGGDMGARSVRASEQEERKSIEAISMPIKSPATSNGKDEGVSMQREVSGMARQESQLDDDGRSILSLPLPEVQQQDQSGVNPP